MNKHIFIIPSWYPWEENEPFGSFIKEQVEYLAKYSSFNYSISLWGQGKFLISIKKSYQVISKLEKFIRSTSFIKKREKNLVELFSPALYWSNKILNGNIEKLIEINWGHIKRAQQIYGKVDLIHAHVSFPAGYIAMKLSEKMKIPYIITEHMGPFPLPNFYSKNGIISDKITEPLGKASGIISVSKFLADEIAKKTGIQSNIIPNQVNELFFNCNPKRVNPNNLIYIGNPSPSKGFNLLIEALKLLSQKYQFHLTAIGIPPELKKTIPTSIAHMVELKGMVKRTEVANAIEKAAILVHPSNYETFGLVVAESMACGKPVVLTKCGGPDEFVAQNRGILVTKRSPEILANAMIQAMTNYQHFDSNNIRTFAMKFHPVTITREIVNFYEKFF